MPKLTVEQLDRRRELAEAAAWTSCPDCHASPGEGCTNSNGAPLRAVVHVSRTRSTASTPKRGAPACSGCGYPMIRPARRCGFCTAERDLGIREVEFDAA